ncbi:MAG TPA: hypothetical protein VK973_00680 [Arenicellales bacterium]|nr:hypothetical protein [Arenicellales bacterium]
MKTLFGLLAAAVILSLTLAWLFRYDTAVGNEPFTVYTLDRWTGEVSLVAPSPAIDSIHSQALEFERTPLAGLGGPTFRERFLEALRSDSGSPE